MATATSVMRVQQLLIGDFDAMVGRHGLTFARYEALVLLAFSREGRLPMSKIGERLMVHPTSATNIIQRLEAQGLVERAPNPDDGRGTLAAITPSGREVMEQATRDLVDRGFGLAALSAPSSSSCSCCCARCACAGDFDDDLPRTTTSLDPDHDVAARSTRRDPAGVPDRHAALRQSYPGPRPDRSGVRPPVDITRTSK